MSADFYSYISRLHAFIEAQDRRLKALEEQLQTCMAEIKELKEKPAIRVDKIEYKFDQLKVETLEGTLNIGLNPSDLQGIEDFTVDNQTIQTGLSPEEKMRCTIEIEDAIMSYLEKDTEQTFVACEHALQRQFDRSYVSFVQTDVKKQLANRIEYYMNQTPFTDRSENGLKKQQEQIIHKIKVEIEKGIHTFLSNLPENNERV
ncbi:MULTISPECIES: spore germination protein GerPC [unclassified Bacillus (in: firmicutes)]|uniref:spore germination protein GerPC n=1 Tax=unclassified Bacillus (in: firmicutes) TaxID=185979 RepID=UPI0008EE7C61|nr:MULTISPECIES: spore germination protein GerPC [unclassified Bacillus (in: firmicutes)]SFA79452.1 spore germination protein PC [Bacillus sp. UNCCL13]SFQ69471.1 spore germination protein PC [Bacillus sp. cl95]